MNLDIKSLAEALSFSPDNIPLRLLLANLLLNNQHVEEAETHFRIILTQESQNNDAKAGLATCYLQQGKNSGAVVILEELLEAQPGHPDLLMLISRALLRNGERGKAIEYYKQFLIANPETRDDELDSLRPPGANEMHELISSIENSLTVEKPKITFDEVGGMGPVKDEIKIKIIQPLQFPDLYKAYGKKIGGGILLYGPPGCGKTHLARATAGQINAKFISIGIHDVLDMWLGGSEKKLHDLFELARRQTPCVLFFDEIDALGASRSDMRQSAGKMLINQFLTELDGVEFSNDGLLILGATNAPWHLDPAFRRPGRFDRIIFVQPPDAAGREAILKILLKDKPVGQIDFTAISKATDEFSGADLMAVVNRAVEDKLREAFEAGEVKPLQTKDLLKTAKQVKPSTKEWFTSARNYALYSNESGTYDDILDYLNLKK